MNMPGTDSDDLALHRAALIAHIEAEARATASYTGRPAFAPAVLAALARVPRHRFVAPERADLAYNDTALAIGHGQTISQPYIVALMTDLLDLPPAARVLEIGGGSGFQAAVLAELGAQVVSLERVPALADEARARLRALGYARVQVIAADGYDGWPAAAPYDGILVTAAATAVPPPLLEQLKPGCRLVIPLGPPHLDQELVAITKMPDGSFDRQAILPVAFVPFLHGGGEGAGTKPAR
jgi:protein-L-isoaspartate(D-aspartate) O-methyltransferase